MRHHGASAHLRDLKGLADLAVLLARPGVDVHVLELADAGPHDRAGDALLDATARAAYRRRLAELDERPRGRRRRRTTSPGPNGSTASGPPCWPSCAGPRASAAGTARLGTSTSERARKAVTARLREAIHRVGAVLPDLGAHLDRSVLTGTTCRYAPPSP